MYLFQTNEDSKLWKRGQDHLIIENVFCPTLDKN